MTRSFLHRRGQSVLSLFHCSRSRSHSEDTCPNSISLRFAFFILGTQSGHKGATDVLSSFAQAKVKNLSAPVRSAGLWDSLNLETARLLHYSTGTTCRLLCTASCSSLNCPTYLHHPLGLGFITAKC